MDPVFFTVKLLKIRNCSFGRNRSRKVIVFVFILEIKDKFNNLCEEKGLNHEFFITDPDDKPGHMICELAKEKNVDSIVMGQRGLGTISRMLLGSTSDYVLHHAHVPVIVIPKGDRGTQTEN